jgi:hypothetical protein
MKRWLLCCMGILFGIHLLDAQVDFSGYGATGYKWYDREVLRGYNNKAYYEGKLQANIDITKHVEAQLDLRGHSDDSTVEFREFSAKFDYFKDIKIKIGNLRKPFGMEQFEEQEDRLMIDDSYLHRELEELGYAGRAVSMMVYHKPKKKDVDALPYAYYFSFYKNNSLAYGAIARIEYLQPLWKVGGGVFVQNNNSNGSTASAVTTIAASADAEYQGTTYRPSVEVVYAQDPITELQNKIAGKDEVVHTVGIKTIHQFMIETTGSVVTAIEPFVLAGCYVPDMEVLKVHTWQAVLGVNVYFEPQVRVRINGDLLLHKTRYESKYDTYDSRVTTEVQVKF